MNTLNDYSKEELVEILKQKNEEIEDLRKYIKFYHKLQTKNIAIQVKNQMQNAEKMKKFNLEYTWIDKIVFILKALDKPLTAHSLLEIIAQYDHSTGLRTKVERCLSVHLSRATKYGRIIGYKIPGVQKYYYALPQWLDENKKLIKEYLNKLE